MKKAWEDSRRRDRAASVLRSLFKHIRCGTGHEVMLKLSDHLENGTELPSLDIVMSLCPDLSQWQEIECLINSRNPSNTAVRNICADLGQYTGQGKGLVLFIEEDGLFSAWAPSPSQTESPASPKDTLDELIIKGAFGPPDLNARLSGSDPTQYNPQEKRALAVRLGYCLMDFFDVNLSSKRIYLLGSSTVSFRNEPLYLSFKSGLPGAAESHIFRVGHPALLSFAKLLLEIDSGKIIHLDAVKHAVTDWNVDIITMSFGFTDGSEQGCDDLRDAILHAHASGTLIFAAASNAGAHSTAPAFPARLSNVFCIYSGDGMGNSAATNLTARRYAPNFLTLGEAVEGAGKKRKSGTSFATPIAAGIAAFLLLYAYQNLPPGEARRFKEYDKMRDLLFHLSIERGGYNVISVGEFFKRPAEARRILLASLLHR
ncbi:uncharacterized protein DNG_05167 [Cephalotrichum gorgonifer]|uniref:DUF7580 domain-containing protein n=1 Tax=Cephalotrichum gorgonifer TaxID=2041049 RepID=A0AAE8MZ80_9PEZI|nr:uncharacterized protein DNG_05167 [Cephalotrichum gorgonifer]